MVGVGVATGAYTFALDLHRQICPTSTNGIFSPSSILITLAMCWIGSKGRTQLEIKSKIFGNVNHGKDDEFIMSYLDRLMTLVDSSVEKEFLLKAANRLYGQQGFVVKDKFKNALRQTFKSEIIEANFLTNAEQERQKINQWVAQKTNNRIQDLIQKPQLTPATLLVLVNALYLKAKWASVFKGEQTKMGKFHKSSSSNIDVQMMHMTKALSYMENDEYQIIQLPYVNHKVSMVIILPKEKFGLPNVLRNLNEHKLKSSFDALKSYQVDLKLPRFKIEQKFDLNDPLKALGIKEAFDVNKADFSPITDSPKLYISKVLHKAFIEVNENGTEASAATAAILLAGSAFFPENQRRSFVADHPFLFAIMGPQNEHILFMGQYYGSP